MDKSLIILRGLPGSGKSTFAELLHGHICTADDYHCDENGKYNWKRENSTLAHEKCQEKCRKLMNAKAKTIIIANTNITEQQIQPYYNMAKEYGYKVFSIIVENRHNGKNTHDVPEETINEMYKNFNIKLI